MFPTMLSFNSKLVRLKGVFAEAHLASTDLFQFQTGAIKSQPKPGASVRVSHVFQFQTGAIKSLSLFWCQS